MLDDIRVGSQVLTPKEVSKKSIEEATNLFDSKFRRHNQDSDTMEIDVESDSDLSNGQTKNEPDTLKEDEDDFESMPTQILFKKGQLILNII